MKKLKNCYYKKVQAEGLIDGLKHYFEIYDKKKNYVASTLEWHHVLDYNKYGVVYW